MESTWINTFKPKKYPKLDKDIEVDAAIIGGGITGTTAAYLLSKTGMRVALIEKKNLSESVSAYTTAFVRCVVDSRLTELQDFFGADKAKRVWESSREAVKIIGEHVKSEQIDCEFVHTPFYKFANDTTEWEELSADADVAKSYGFEIQKKEDGSGINPMNSGYILVPNQAKFHPLKYLDALRAKAVQAGVLIFEDTEAEEIQETDPFSIKTSGGMVQAGKILISTYDPFNKPKKLFAHKGIYTTYVLELKISQGKLEEVMY